MTIASNLANCAHTSASGGRDGFVAQAVVVMTPADCRFSKLRESVAGAVSNQLPGKRGESDTLVSNR